MACFNFQMLPRAAVWSMYMIVSIGTLIPITINDLVMPYSYHLSSHTWCPSPLLPTSNLLTYQWYSCEPHFLPSLPALSLTLGSARMSLNSDSPVMPAWLYLQFHLIPDCILETPETHTVMYLAYWSTFWWYKNFRMWCVISPLFHSYALLWMSCKAQHLLQAL